MNRREETARTQKKYNPDDDEGSGNGRITEKGEPKRHKLLQLFEIQWESATHRSREYTERRDQVHLISRQQSWAHPDLKSATTNDQSGDVKHINSGVKHGDNISFIFTQTLNETFWATDLVFYEIPNMHDLYVHLLVNDLKNWTECFPRVN